MPAKHGSKRNRSEVETSKKETSDATSLATIAALLMPRMEAGPGGQDPNPEALRAFYAGQRTFFDPEKRLKQDGTSNLDVMMEEALYRARLLLDRAANQPSPTVEAWTKMIEGEAKNEEMISRLKKEVAVMKGSIPWQKVAKMALPKSTPEMLKIYWRAFQASEIALRHEEATDENLVFVWESEASLQQKGDPSVRVRPDALIPLTVRAKSVLSTIAKFVEFYERFGPSLRKKVQRKAGIRGRKKQAERNWPAE